MEMESVKCALCGSDDSELLFVGHDRLHGVPGEFHVVRCPECSLVYLNPRPTWNEMREFYPANYAPHSLGPSSLLQKWIQRGGLQKKRHLVRKYKACGTLLDVGCATGDFLQAMSDNGNWRLFGLEPDAESARQAAQISGAEVFCGRLEDADYPPHSLSVVTMWHVLEHLYDPVSTLGKLRRALKPDGVLVAAIPVLDSVDAKVFGPYWSGYDVPRHLFTYSVSTLSKMLACSGFSFPRLESFIGGCAAFRISLGFWTEELQRSQPSFGFVRTASRSTVFRLLMSPYFWIANRLGRGSTVVAVAGPLE